MDLCLRPFPWMVRMISEFYLTQFRSLQCIPSLITTNTMLMPKQIKLMDGCTKSDSFSEKIQMAFKPPPLIFGKLCRNIFITDCFGSRVGKIVLVAAIDWNEIRKKIFFCWSWSLTKLNWKPCSEQADVVSTQLKAIEIEFVMSYAKLSQIAVK